MVMQAEGPICEESLVLSDCWTLRQRMPRQARSENGDKEDKDEEKEDKEEKEEEEDKDEEEEDGALPRLVWPWRCCFACQRTLVAEEIEMPGSQGKRGSAPLANPASITVFILACALHAKGLSIF